MRKISILLLLISSIASGQGKSIAVPDAVKSAFHAKFPNATNVTWGKENKYEYEAEFNTGNTSVAANFKADGSWVVTETTVPATDLPVKVSAAVTNKYAGGIITGAEKIEKPGDNIYYEIIVVSSGKKKEVNISTGGKLIK